MTKEAKSQRHLQVIEITQNLMEYTSERMLAQAEPVLLECADHEETIEVELHLIISSRKGERKAEMTLYDMYKFGESESDSD